VTSSGLIFSIKKFAIIERGRGGNGKGMEKRRGKGDIKEGFAWAN